MIYYCLLHEFFMKLIKAGEITDQWPIYMQYPFLAISPHLSFPRRPRVPRFLKTKTLFSPSPSGLLKLCLAVIHSGEFIPPVPFFPACRPHNKNTPWPLVWNELCGLTNWVSERKQRENKITSSGLAPNRHIFSSCMFIASLYFRIPVPLQSLERFEHKSSTTRLY